MSMLGDQARIGSCLRACVTYRATSTITPPIRNVMRTSSNDSPSMFGCSSTAVAQPNHTSLTNSPTTKETAATTAPTHQTPRPKISDLPRPVPPA